MRRLVQEAALAVCRGMTIAMTEWRGGNCIQSSYCHFRKYCRCECARNTVRAGSCYATAPMPIHAQVVVGGAVGGSKREIGDVFAWGALAADSGMLSSSGTVPPSPAAAAQPPPALPGAALTVHGASRAGSSVCAAYALHLRSTIAENKQHARCTWRKCYAAAAAARRR